MYVMFAMAEDEAALVFAFSLDRVRYVYCT